MGTHPIFESDFDCLTDVMTGKKNHRRKKNRSNKISELDSLDESSRESLDSVEQYFSSLDDTLPNDNHSLSEPSTNESIPYNSGTKSIKGAIKRFWIFPTGSKVLMLFMVCFACLLPSLIKFLPQSPAELRTFSMTQLEHFRERKKLFKERYLSRFSISHKSQNSLWSALKYQREEPPEEPLIFLLFSRNVTHGQIEFAHNLCSVARRQTVAELAADQIKSRHEFTAELLKHFTMDRSVVVNRLDEMEPKNALALYGISDSNGIDVAKNKTIALLFQSPEIDEHWSERDHPRLLQNWIEAGKVNLGENRGLISRIANHVMKIS